jgi:hypothetical protein
MDGPEFTVSRFVFRVSCLRVFSCLRGPNVFAGYRGGERLDHEPAKEREGTKDSGHPGFSQGGFPGPDGEMTKGEGLPDGQSAIANQK